MSRIDTSPVLCLRNVFRYIYALQKYNIACYLITDKVILLLARRGNVLLPIVFRWDGSFRRCLTNTTARHNHR